MPGAYKVSFAKRQNGVITPFGKAQEFEIIVDGQDRMTSADRLALVEFQTKLHGCSAPYRARLRRRIP